MSDLKLRHVIKGPEVLLQDLKGEAVLLNLANGLYYGLDENSYHMYKTLIACGSVQEAYEALCQEYEVEPAQLKADLDRFIAHLLENGLLTFADEQAK
jgi:hypothetical protein